MGGSTEATVVIQDVEMEVVEDPETVKKDADLVSVQEIRDHARQIEKAVVSKEPRFILRVLRSLPNTRRKMNAVVLRSLALHLYPAGLERESILAFIEALPIGVAEPELPRARTATKSPLPEVDAYVHLLILVRLLDANELKLASQCSETLMKKIVGQNRRSLDLIAAKSYFYHSRVAELNGTLESIRSFLHARLRTATLRNDYEGKNQSHHVCLLYMLSYKFSFI